jgi:hypothetical protein
MKTVSQKNAEKRARRSAKKKRMLRSHTNKQITRRVGFDPVFAEPYGSQYALDLATSGMLVAALSSTLYAKTRRSQMRAKMNTQEIVPLNGDLIA